MLLYSMSKCWLILFFISTNYISAPDSMVNTLNTINADISMYKGLSLQRRHCFNDMIGVVEIFINIMEYLGLSKYDAWQTDDFNINDNFSYDIQFYSLCFVSKSSYHSCISLYMYGITNFLENRYSKTVTRIIHMINSMLENAMSEVLSVKKREKRISALRRLVKKDALSNVVRNYNKPINQMRLFNLLYSLILEKISINGIFLLPINIRIKLSNSLKDIVIDYNKSYINLYFNISMIIAAKLGYNALVNRVFYTMIRDRPERGTLADVAWGSIMVRSPCREYAEEVQDCFARIKHSLLKLPEFKALSQENLDNYIDSILDFEKHQIYMSKECTDEQIDAFVCKYTQYNPLPSLVI